MMASQIIHETARAYQVPQNTMRQRVNKGGYYEQRKLARWEAWYRLKTERELSYPQIARIFNMHHTTIMHGVKKHIERVGEVA